MNWLIRLFQRMSYLQKMAGEDIYQEDPSDPRRKLPGDAFYQHLGEDKPQLGDRVFEHYGVWMYPFKKVKRDSVEGYYLDWFDEPGSIHDISKVQAGDKIADRALNMTPYWEVSGIDPDKGRIYVNPIEPNPFVTGVGAGSGVGSGTGAGSGAGSACGCGAGWGSGVGSETGAVAGAGPATSNVHSPGM